MAWNLRYTMKTAKLQNQLIELSVRVKNASKINATAAILPTGIELSDNIELPFIFQAEALHPGTYKGFTIEEQEIIKAKDTIFHEEDNFRNYEINKDHKSSRKMDSSVSDVVGRIVASDWNPASKALILTGHVYDKEMALKIINGLISFVSLRISPGRIDEDATQKFARDLAFEELSFVRAPGDPNARIINF